MHAMFGHIFPLKSTAKRAHTYTHTYIKDIKRYIYKRYLVYSNGASGLQIETIRPMKGCQNVLKRCKSSTCLSQGLFALGLLQA